MFASLILRLGIAVIFIYHGFPKLRAPAQVAQGIGWTPLAVQVLGAVEFLSGVLLVLGPWSHLAGLVLAFVMFGAIYYKIMKWHMPFSAHDKMGWEFDLVLLAACLSIFLSSLKSF